MIHAANFTNYKSHQWSRVLYLVLPILFFFLSELTTFKEISLNLFMALSNFPLSSARIHWKICKGRVRVTFSSTNVSHTPRTNPSSLANHDSRLNSIPFPKIHTPGNYECDSISQKYLHISSSYGIQDEILLDQSRP